jgi:enolase-phosphatase E1
VSALVARGVSALLLDIEGTTTPIAFVYDVLFPFARSHLHGWIQQHRRTLEFDALASALEAEYRDVSTADAEVPPWDVDARERSVEQFALWLMDRDRKSPALKQLQGMLWAQGYREGILRGVVFPDVAPAIRRWHDAGLFVAIYSSGSELAQRLLFESTEHGDLTPYIGAFFDTAVGSKREPGSYSRIAVRLGRTPREVLFISDITGELRAAQAAGLQVVMSVRPGNRRTEADSPFAQITTFDELA